MITEKQFQAAADLIKCKVAAIKAVYAVETAGRGYLPDGRVKILFEGHRFWKRLVKHGFNPLKILNEHPGYRDVLYGGWDKSKYIGGAAEWDRHSKANELCKMIGADPDIALMSASFGSFQIMGENCQACGYATAHEMVAAYNLGGEAEQLNSFVRFVKSKKLDVFLRTENWKAFANGYNGTGSALNEYAPKMLRKFNYYLLAA